MILLSVNVRPDASNDEYNHIKCIYAIMLWTGGAHSHCRKPFIHTKLRHQFAHISK